MINFFEGAVSAPLDKLINNVKTIIYKDGYMIQIPDIKEENALLVNPNGEIVGNIYTVNQLNAIRCQIKREKLVDYKVRQLNKNDELIQEVTINKNGCLVNMPKNFFNIVNKYLDELIDL